MARIGSLAMIFALAVACSPDSPNATAHGSVGSLIKNNATFVGYLLAADQPDVIARFNDGVLQWRADPASQSMAQGRAEPFNSADRHCVGFAQKAQSMPTHGPQRFLVCEALSSIQHRNNLPRSQDFYFKRGDLFLEYQPPPGTGFPQVYYLGEQKK